MEFDNQSQAEVIESRHAETSLGIKLTLGAVSLLLFGFIVYSVITIRISQGNLVANIKSDLTKETADTIFLIQSKIEESSTAAVNLAISIEAGVSEEADLQKLLEKSISTNDQILGMTIGFEPNQLKPDLPSWAFRYLRSDDGTIQSTRLDDYSKQEWYLRPKSTFDITVSAPHQYDDTIKSRWVITTSVPFFDDAGNFKGVASTDLDMAVIQGIFMNIRVERIGYAFLIDDKGSILGIGKQGQEYEPMVDTMYAFAQSNGSTTWLNLIDNMTQENTGFEEATDWEGNRMYVAYAPVGMDTGWSLALVYPQDDVLQKTRSLQTTLTGYSIVLAILFGFVILYFSRNITNPLIRLTQAAEEISKGNLQVSVDVETNDEVGILSETINRMTGQLRDTLTNLEQRITDRTQDLESERRKSEIRANQYLAISEIGKLINSEQDLSILLPLIARLVSEQFDCYHIGIFLVDSTNQFAVLQASNSEGGRNLLVRGFKIALAEGGIFARVFKTGAPRFISDIRDEPGGSIVSELSRSRSEAVYPLKARDTMIGILDIQNEKPGFFAQMDTTIFGILADQIAIAIDNTRLFQQTEQALFEARSAYQQSLQKGWRELAQEENTIGYIQSLSGGRRLSKPISADEIDQAMFRGETLIFHADGKTSEPTLVVPIKLRDQIIGIMHIKSPLRERQWMQTEVELVEAVSERLSLALENARLIQESQRQAFKEQTIGEITNKIGSSVNLYNVLATAVEELGRTMPGSEVTIKLKNDTGNGNGSG